MVMIITNISICAILYATYKNSKPQICKIGQNKLIKLGVFFFFWLDHSLPFIRQKTSQLLRPLPSSRYAPSILKKSWCKNIAEETDRVTRMKKLEEEIKKAKRRLNWLPDKRKWLLRRETQLENLIF